MGARRTKKKTTSARAKGKAAPDNNNRTILWIVGIVAGLAIMGWLRFLALRPAQAIPGVVQFPWPARGHNRL